jgi:virulence factor Mce-like protein
MSTLRRPALRRPTRRRDTEPVGRSIVKSLVTLAFVGLFVWIGVSSYNGVPLRHYSSLYVNVPDVGNLIRHDPVRIAGVQVGQVFGESVTPAGGARVKLQIEPGVQLPVGTSVEVRANGLLGARYVQLTPGTSARLLTSGATIDGGPNALSFGVPETLNTLDAQTRGALGEMIDGLGSGLLGHGAQLNTGLHDVAGAAGRFTALAKSLLAQPGSVDRLLPSVDALVTPLNQVRGELVSMLSPAAQALEPLVTDRLQVRQILQQAPGALVSAQRGLGTGERLLAAAGSLATAAQQALPPLPGGLRETTFLLEHSPAPLRKATTLLRTAQPAIPAALQITSGLSPVLQPLGQALDGADPIIQYVAPRGCDLENFGAVMRSMTGFGGTGTGPVGPAMEFRAQLALGAEALDPLSHLAPAQHDAYPAPCRYVDKTYPDVPPLVNLAGTP